MEAVTSHRVIRENSSSSKPSSTAGHFIADTIVTEGLSPLKISEFVNFPPNTTPGNVGVAISGGSSRSMIAGMGQLRGLKNLNNAQGNLLEQTKAISAVSGGSWLSVLLMYSTCSDDTLLGLYQDPSAYTVESLQQLDPDNMGTRCTKNFSAQALAVQAVLLIAVGIPANLVWQTLIGLHLLKHYGLDSQAKGIPTGFFSYDEDYLTTHILNSNPTLANQTVNLVASENGQQVRRPYFICNASMFVNVPGQFHRTLVPVQITPFFTGIFASPPNAFDANQQLVGGGGVASFAFNSNLEEINLEKASVNQTRQFSLADAAGVSSSFFAEYLAKQGTVWHNNSKQFFAEAQGHLSLDDWQPMLDSLPPALAHSLRCLLNELQTLCHTHIEVGQAQLVQKNIDPSLFTEAFNKLSAIVPQYQYWSVNAKPNNDVQATDFADGGNLENTGIAALLTYQDIDNIIAFVNCSKPLTAGQYGMFDASEQEIPDTRIVVDAQIPPLFGYQAYDENLGYRLYNQTATPNHPLFRNNQIFPSDAFPELLQALWQISGNKDNPGSNQHAANYLQQITTVDNVWLGVKGGKKINVFWVYNNLISDWYEQLSPAVQQQVFNNDPSSYNNFPQLQYNEYGIDAHTN